MSPYRTLELHVTFDTASPHFSRGAIGRSFFRENEPRVAHICPILADVGFHRRSPNLCMLQTAHAPRRVAGRDSPVQIRGIPLKPTAGLNGPPKGSITYAEATTHYGWSVGNAGRLFNPGEKCELVSAYILATSRNRNL
jgi:hypothetical protein